MKAQAIIRSVVFPSKSTPGLQYTALKYADGSESCNCPGWARRVSDDGSRNCRHIEQAFHKGVRIAPGSSQARFDAPEGVPVAKGKAGHSPAQYKAPARRIQFDEDD